MTTTVNAAVLHLRHWNAAHRTLLVRLALAIGFLLATATALSSQSHRRGRSIPDFPMQPAPDLVEQPTTRFATAPPRIPEATTETGHQKPPRIITIDEPVIIEGQRPKS
jgi:hypothetical protein